MKKLLALALFLSFSVSAFAVPTCSDTEWHVEGGDSPMYNKLLGYETGTAQEPPDVEFYCKVAGIEPGETYYLDFFSWQTNPIGEKSSSSQVYFDKKSYTSMIKMYKHLEAAEQDKDKLAKYTTIRENLESEFKGYYEYNKIWQTTAEDTIWPEDFSGYWPTKVTSAENGKEYKVKWIGGHSNQPGSTHLVPLNAFSFIGFCTNQSDPNSCVGIEDRYDIPRTNYFSAYEVEDETYNDLTSKTITVSYGATDNAQIDMYIYKPEFSMGSISIAARLGNNLHNLMGEYLVAHRSLGVKGPLKSSKVEDEDFQNIDLEKHSVARKSLGVKGSLKSGEVEYEYFSGIDSGTYILLVRYIREPRKITTRDYLPSAVFSTRGIIDYDPTGIEDGLKKEVFVTLLNNKPGTEYTNIKLSEENRGSILTMSAIDGRGAKTIKLKVGDNIIKEQGISPGVVVNEKKRIYQEVKILN